ncbi:MAG: NAD(P)H-dependent oxidoreductase [Treponemataceae bacterium]|nr:NAD(P)H-dependent oxidoreductase [Treponemataceae bacterium]
MKTVRGIFLLLLSAALTCSAQHALPPESVPAKHKVLIAYFTWAENTALAPSGSAAFDAETSASLTVGNTAIMAGYIEAVTGGDLFSIVVADPYPSDYNGCLSRAKREQAKNARPALKRSVENMDDYDIVFLGYPNWWNTIPMAVRTFLERYDFSGKTVIPFCAHGTGGLARTVRDVRSALPQATVLDALGISRSDMKNAKTLVTAWLAGLGFGTQDSPVSRSD